MSSSASSQTNNYNISITPRAEAHIRNQLELTHAKHLRLGVKESGCNGYMYLLDFLELPERNDLQIDFGNGVNLCVSQTDLSLVEGTEVDLVTQGLNSALVFKNPKATSYCGCGESFALGGVTGETGNTSTGQSVATDLATDVGSK
ncbi:MAG: iron-sulfur cluster assembly accessory protein [Gammaproteobacteria bacterium]|nr:iron-sulfur cluster assembly accessory protein [Gammaproteobacteria bacterium]